MRYETPRLVLTPFSREIANSSNYRNWFRNPEVTKYNSHGLFPEDVDEFLDSLKTDQSRIVWAIAFKRDKLDQAPDGTLANAPEFIHVGNVSLQRIDFINRSGEIAIVLGETDYWGKGIATEAIRLVMNHAFLRLGLHRLWSGTAAPNWGMRKVFLRLGFQAEGNFKDAVYLNGRHEDVVEFGLTRPDWDKWKEARNEKAHAPADDLDVDAARE